MMHFIAWEAEYDIGIPEIDNQHQQLVNIINRLYEAIKYRLDDGVYQAIINQLVDYTQYHFKSEEKYIKYLIKKDRRLHVLQHQSFIKEVIQLQEQGLQRASAIEVWYFLSDWLITHIVSEDIKLFKHYTRHLKRC